MAFTSNREHIIEGALYGSRHTRSNLRALLLLFCALSSADHQSNTTQLHSMYLSPVAMFEPILRDLQRMAAPDVDAETEAALCDSITQSVRNYRSLPDSKLTPSVLKKLIIEKKVKWQQNDWKEGGVDYRLRRSVKHSHTWPCVRVPVRRGTVVAVSP